MSLKLNQIVFECLKQNAEQKFTARQIAEWIFETYPDECREKQKKSKAKAVPLDTDEALVTQLVSEIGSQRPSLQKKHPHIKTTEERPKKYYYTELSDSSEIDLVEASEPTQSPKEYELYPQVSRFLFTELEIYSKRIDEKRSTNKRGSGGNKWLYPDLVGMENLGADWHREINDCVKECAARKARLWSFEVKVQLNPSNVREAFFQTVSNSSWAHLGYLVAAEIRTDTLKELRMLTSLHGIGVIRLSTDEPSESEILIPARERSEIDWDTANRLVNENADFREYIKSIRQFYQTGDVKKSDWARTDAA